MYLEIISGLIIEMELNLIHKIKSYRKFLNMLLQNNFIIDIIKCYLKQSHNNLKYLFPTLLTF